MGFLQRTKFMVKGARDVQYRLPKLQNFVDTHSDRICSYCGYNFGKTKDITLLEMIEHMEGHEEVTDKNLATYKQWVQ